MLEGKKSKSGGGARKHGRDKKKCELYGIKGRREKNKIRKIRRHLKRHSQDLSAQTALEKLK